MIDHWENFNVVLRCCCSWCPFKAERYLTVKKHIQSEHESKQNYPCPQCSFIGKISSKGARFYWRSTISAPSMMEYASHMDSHKGKQGQKTSWLLKGNRSNLAKFQPLEIKTTSQRKTLVATQVKSNKLVQQELMQQAVMQQLLLKKQQNLQPKFPKTNCAYEGGNKYGIKVCSPLLVIIES